MKRFLHWISKKKKNLSSKMEFFLETSFNVSIILGKAQLSTFKYRIMTLQLLHFNCGDRIKAISSFGKP